VAATIIRTRSSNTIDFHWIGRGPVAIMSQFRNWVARTFVDKDAMRTAFVCWVAVLGSLAGAQDPKAEPKVEPKAEPKVEPKTEPKASADTPEDAVKRFDAALAALNKSGSKDDELHALLGVFDESFATAMKSLFEMSAKVAASQKALKAVMETQFPKDSAGRERLPDFGKLVRNFRDELAPVRKVEAGAKTVRPDGRVLITVKSTVTRTGAADVVKEEQYLAARNEAGLWKLLPVKLEDPKNLKLLTVQVEAFKRAPEMLDKVAKDVSEGKFKSRDEADQAAFSAFLTAVQKLQQN